MKKNTRIILQITVLLLVLGSVGTVWIFLDNREIASPGKPAKPVLTAMPIQADLEETVLAWGNLRSADMVSILPRVAGSITAAYVEVGDGVVKGQILAEIDREAYRLAYEQAEAARSATASSWERIDRLYSSGSATRQNWENARASHLAAEAQASVARLRYDWTLVSSPTTGVVLRKHVNAGSLVSPEAGMPLYTVGSLENLELEISLPEVWYPAFIGDDIPLVNLKSDSFPELVIVGEIRSVAPWVDPVTRSFQVVCGVSSDKAWLRPGMLLSAEFVTGYFKDVFILPETALSRGTGIWKAEDSREARFVDLDNPRLINGYLLVPPDKANANYIVEGQHFLKEGDEVQIIGDGQ